MPDEAEAHGLLALLLLTDARSRARVVDGELVSLAEQDRSRWDAARSRRACACSSARCGCRGRASTRSRPRSPPCTTQAPVVRRHRLGADRRPLRRAGAARPVAGGGGQPRGRGRFAEGRRPGCALPDDPRLARYQPLHAARAELLRRAGDVAGADAALGAAIELSATEPRAVPRCDRLGSAARRKPASAPAGTARRRRASRARSRPRTTRSRPRRRTPRP